ncbi:mitochondrial metal transporter [Oleoguttula sp. CCFEE 5521]
MSATLAPRPAPTRSHSHHSHSHDNTYLTSTNKADPGVRITRLGLYVNLGMALLKGTGGYVFNSQALTADAVHALTDLVSDVTTLATISYSLRPPTTRFPMGYGKIESLGALGVSGLLLSGGVMIGLQALTVLSAQFAPALGEMIGHLAVFGHSHSHSHAETTGTEGVNINAAWLAAGSIVVKEYLYRATIKIAKRKRSSILASNAYHHRVDSLTSFVALVVISASHFLANAQWLDPVGGLIISAMIVQAGWGNTKNALLELADVGMEGEIRGGVERSAKLALVGAGFDEATVRGVQGVKSGQNFLVEVELGVPAGWSVGDTAEVESTLREKVAKDVKGVRRVSVRFVVENEGDAFLDEFVAGRLSDAEDGGHDHEHEHGHGHDHAHETTAKSTSVQTNGSAHTKK